VTRISDPTTGGQSARTARLLLVLACLGWGVGFPLMKAVMQAQHEATGADSMWLTAQHQLTRYVAACALLTGLAWWFGRRLPNRAEWTQGAVCGASAAIGMHLQIDALNHAPASTVGFITQFYVLVIPLVTALRLRRRPGWATIASVGLALTGVAVLCGISPGDLQPGVGELMVLAASIIFTVQIFALEAPRWAGNNGLQVTAAMFAVMSVLDLPLVASTGLGLSGVATCLAVPGTAAITVIIILLCTCLPYAIMNRWQREVSSTEAGIIYCSEAVFSACGSLFLPAVMAGALGIAYANETPTVTMMVGGALILAGAVLVQLAPRWRSALRPPPTLS
jgi:drug/metabolite transporter (DMT)-like permease